MDDANISLHHVRNHVASPPFCLRRPASGRPTSGRPGCDRSPNHPAGPSVQPVKRTRSQAPWPRSTRAALHSLLGPLRLASSELLTHYTVIRDIPGMRSERPSLQ